MGNALAIVGKNKKTIKVMKIDGTTLKFKPPSIAGDVLRDHAGFSLLDSEEVKHFTFRARPLDPYRPLKPGHLYFLVELPRPPVPDRSRAPPRRAWSANLHVGARERLESLMLSRRAVSDLSIASKPSVAVVEGEGTGALRLKVRLPKAEVAKLVEESKDSIEAAEKIMKLFAAKEEEVGSGSGGGGSPAPAMAETAREQFRRKEQKRTRFLPLPDEIIV